MTKEGWPLYDGKASMFGHWLESIVMLGCGRVCYLVCIDGEFDEHGLEHLR